MMPVNRVPKTSGLGIAGMVLGLLGLCTGITSLPAVICSHISLSAIRRSGGQLTGKGMAITGLITGYIGLAGFGLIIGSVGIKASKAGAEAARAGSPYEQSSVAVPTFPALPTMAPLGNSDVTVGQLRLQDGIGPGGTMEMRIYLPAGNHAAGSLRCVLVAPAGTTLLSGTDIGSLDEDAYHDECLPYAEAGMAVVMYSLDGNLDDADAEDRDKTKAAYERFRAAQAGLVNARNALEFTLTRMPQVDRTKIFAAGHSSAATLALLFGEHEPRLAGCVAYAPATDVEARLKEIIDNPFSGATFPECKSFLKRSSPMTHADQLKIPVFLFHAANDKNVPAADSRDFAASLKARGADITFREVPQGGHYDAMIEEGIPAGIEWMKGR